LSDTTRAVLTAAAARNDHLIAPPKLPVAAARQVVRSLLNAGLAEEVPAPISDPGYAWRTGEDGGVLALRATASWTPGTNRAKGLEDLAGAIAADVLERVRRVGPNQTGRQRQLLGLSAGRP
jgi:hypothetical protein